MTWRDLFSLGHQRQPSDQEEKSDEGDEVGAVPYSPFIYDLDEDELAELAEAVAYGNTRNDDDAVAVLLPPLRSNNSDYNDSSSQSASGNSVLHPALVEMRGHEERVHKNIARRYVYVYAC